jgi:methyl coenzyme M reductase gamma subunit
LNWQQAASIPVHPAASSYPGSPDLINKKRRWFQSENIIRKQIAILEKELHKYGQHRQPGESVSQWFNRLEINISEAAIIKDIYEKVRYGETIETSEERKQFKQSLKMVRQKLKETRSQNE